MAAGRKVKPKHHYVPTHFCEVPDLDCPTRELIGWQMCAHAKHQRLHLLFTSADLHHCKLIFKNKLLNRSDELMLVLEWRCTSTAMAFPWLPWLLRSVTHIAIPAFLSPLLVYSRGTSDVISAARCMPEGDYVERRGASPFHRSTVQSSNSRVSSNAILNVICRNQRGLV